MKLSRFGILGPAWTPVEPEKIDAVLVPGLAFDYQGYRIGYGRGYYDLFTAEEGCLHLWGYATGFKWLFRCFP